MPDLEQLRYPVGRFERLRAPLDADRRRACIDTIEQAPARLRALVAGRSEDELDTPYRPGGWTVRQVVHHVPDSHMNAYIRMKFAVTEEAPAIKAYNEADWAELPEAKSGPAEISLALLEALHRRWVAFLRALPPDRFARAYVHPELGRVTLRQLLATWVAHDLGHIAQTARVMAKRYREAVGPWRAYLPVLDR